MKRKILILLTLALVTLPLLSLPVSAEGGEASVDAWWAFWERIDVEALRAWFEIEVLPHLAAVATVLGVALVELIPAVRSLLRAKSAFTKVASDVDAYNQSKIEYDLRMEEREKAFEERIERLQEAHNKQVEKLNETVQTYEQKLSESEARMTELLCRIEARASKVERMVYLGMSNSCELVANGAARRIAEIEEEENISEEEKCYYE